MGEGWADIFILTFFGPGLTWLLISFKSCLKSRFAREPQTAADTSSLTAPSIASASALDDAGASRSNAGAWPVERSFSIEQIGAGRRKASSVGGGGASGYPASAAAAQYADGDLHAMLYDQGAGSYMHRNTTC